MPVSAGDWRVSRELLGYVDANKRGRVASMSLEDHDWETVFTERPTVASLSAAEL